MPFREYEGASLSVLAAAALPVNWNRDHPLLLTPDLTPQHLPEQLLSFVRKHHLKPRYVSEDEALVSWF